MTPEKFRQWIVILFAVSILTVWMSLLLNTRGRRLRSVPRQRQGEMREMMRERQDRARRVRTPMQPKVAVSPTEEKK
ncbi:MAG: hypothetical protein HQ579_01915 [Candidatus Omnitrophica bacterium]|nr:hypothetical protein [Candidatus Omnitrophota bacterium]